MSRNIGVSPINPSHYYGDATIERVNGHSTNHGTDKPEEVEVEKDFVTCR
jgi:hypothetical protein